MDDTQKAIYEARISALEGELSRLRTAYEHECAIVEKVWKALEIETYPHAHGKAIHELVAELKAREYRGRGLLRTVPFYDPVCRDWFQEVRAHLKTSL